MEGSWYPVWQKRPTTKRDRKVDPYRLIVRICAAKNSIATRLKRNYALGAKTPKKSRRCWKLEHLSVIERPS